MHEAQIYNHARSPSLIKKLTERWSRSFCLIRGRNEVSGITTLPKTPTTITTTYWDRGQEVSGLARGLVFSQLHTFRALFLTYLPTYPFLPFSSAKEHENFLPQNLKIRAATALQGYKLLLTPNFFISFFEILQNYLFFSKYLLNCASYDVNSLHHSCREFNFLRFCI